MKEQERCIRQGKWKMVTGKEKEPRARAIIHELREFKSEEHLPRVCPSPRVRIYGISGIRALPLAKKMVFLRHLNLKPSNSWAGIKTKF